MNRESSPALCVLTPDPLLTVEIEGDRAGGAPEIHVHPGGQGLWVAKMAESLGARVVVCGPFGGETGELTAHLARTDNLELRPTAHGGGAVVVQDRRSGEAEEIAVMPPEPLDRHALDDLYSMALVTALDADVCVLTGTQFDLGVPADLFGRLARDLAASGRAVVADLSGDAARAVAQEAATVLKISHEELVEGGFAKDDSVGALRAAATEMIDGGPGAVVVSRADEPTLLVTADATWTVTTPPVTTVDHRGAGDSMTAGIAVGVGRGLELPDAVSLGAAAGALNVARHGLGTGRRDQIESFARRVTVETLD
ncbi:PfkB family carbohydrate kinase [Isoptericola variabilis]|uniref:PfkB domain protein n=1 Tax=Isoptericola variabilis (strain 225) TaxID=743718 RepID=F6FTS4_ISOV2|nr:PfkB family carbohydrate kinase [Isoptericola variabilis]AEG44201.1 PfkB domain protein [Isoptericola variabilis 225]